MRKLVASIMLFAVPAVAGSPNPYEVGRMTYGTDMMQNECGFAVSALYEAGVNQSALIDGKQFFAGYEAGPDLWDKLLKRLGPKRFCDMAIREYGPKGTGHVYRP